MVLTLLAAGVGLIVDHRVITGAPAWVKPAKFAISFSIYCFTFVWLLTFVQRWKKLVALVTAVSTIGVIGEMGLIVLQVVRGVASHFNRATTFDSTIYSTMGTFAVLLWVGAFLTAILLLFERRTEKALLWSLLLGLVIAMVGMYVGVMMTQPTAMQLAAKHAGHALLISGAHSVDAPDSSPGLPFLGWSTVGGDLRIAHFVGLHALQVLPLVGWLLSGQRFSCLRIGHRVALIWTISLGYLGLVASLLWQALRGQSLIAPDALTWLTWSGVVGLTLLAIVAIVVHARLNVIHSTRLSV
ncbi:hypothetical protein KSB_18500 [Ktedonobacter robiniae]|uniref:Uncharacterized protein n=2 Tax=Ktedonobacter robiniae TaxID=2778365 RepID=A0ABQ3UL34_9CHLR|nr:hypothetical protein KSB_18500 [Ktedonobacter robiniae]